MAKKKAKENHKEERHTEEKHTEHSGGCCGGGHGGPGDKKHGIFNHMIMMIVICGGLFALIFLAQRYFNAGKTGISGSSYAIWIMLILCVGMHIWMMRGSHSHK